MHSSRIRCEEVKTNEMHTHSNFPFRLAGFDHISFLVDDLPKAVNFYIEVIGCERGYSYPAGGMEQLWCGNALIVLVDLTHPGTSKPVSPVGQGRNVDHLCIATGPFRPNELRAHFEKHGVPIVEEAFHGGARGEGHAFFVHDPFGNLLEIKGPGVYPDGTATKAEAHDA
jgi:glyoxylase I family protein